MGDVVPLLAGGLPFDLTGERFAAALLFVSVLIAIAFVVREP
jgi:hypothetical protein